MDGIATLKLRSPKENNPMNLYHENYDVIHCDYSLTKSTTARGQVDESIRAGNINVVLPILPDANILAWVFDSQKKYNGEITINDSQSEALEKIYFEEARPINFRFHYEPGDTTNVVICLTINAQRIIIGDAEFINKR